MTDKESKTSLPLDSEKNLLILAAKAVGIEGEFERNDAYPYQEKWNFVIPYNNQGMMTGIIWNPLTSNSDCFRLETALGVTLEWCDDWECPHVKARIGERYASAYYLDHNGDKDKARRYASTRAAALMGRE